MSLSNELRFHCDGYIWSDGRKTPAFLMEIKGDKLLTYENPAQGIMEYLLVREHNAKFFPEKGQALFVSETFRDFKVLSFNSENVGKYDFEKQEFDLNNIKELSLIGILPSQRQIDFGAIIYKSSCFKKRG